MRRCLDFTYYMKTPPKMSTTRGYIVVELKDCLSIEDGGTDLSDRVVHDGYNAMK